MNPYTKISIITPSYNQAQYLEETVLSVLDQHYSNLEYIIIDGGSTDDSIEIIKKYEKHLSYWVSEKDSGQAEAINKGLKKATGEIVTWVNSDDLLANDALNKVAKYFNDFPEIGLIHGSTSFLNKNRENNTDAGYENPSLERYLAGMAFPQPSSFFRRGLLDKTGLLNEAYHYGMDYDLFSRLALVTQFKKKDDVLSFYRIHSQSKSVKNYYQFIEDWINIFISLIENLHLNTIKLELKKLNVFNEYLIKSHSSNSQIYKQSIQIDENKLFFYFLSYVLRGWYAAGQFEKSKIILNYIQKNYSNTEILSEKGIPHIEKHLGIFPITLLKLWRKFNNTID